LRDSTALYSMGNVSNECLVDETFRRKVVYLHVGTTNKAETTGGGKYHSSNTDMYSQKLTRDISFAPWCRESNGRENDTASNIELSTES
jgi:hypothetical protein